MPFTEKNIPDWGNEPITIKTSLTLFLKEVYYIPDLGYFKATNILGIERGKATFELSPTKRKCGYILRKTKFEFVNSK